MLVTMRLSGVKQGMLQAMGWYALCSIPACVAYIQHPAGIQEKELRDESVAG
jgi:hypothetical protein